MHIFKRRRRRRKENNVQRRVRAKASCLFVFLFVSLRLFFFFLLLKSNETLWDSLPSSIYECWKFLREFLKVFRCYAWYWANVIDRIAANVEILPISLYLIFIFHVCVCVWLKELLFYWSRAKEKWFCLLFSFFRTMCKQQHCECIVIPLA